MSFLPGACLLLLDDEKLCLAKPMCSCLCRDAVLTLHPSLLNLLHLISSLALPTPASPPPDLPPPRLSPWWGVLGVCELLLSASSWFSVVN